ncbi:MAG TPA: MFS transporter [Bacillota bacterium]|nr:MFS transporter [Bacillota bacterium]
MSALLRSNRVFRSLWLAQAGSWFGDYFNNVALAAVTLSLTGSAVAIGLVLLCRGVPAFVAGPLWGPAIDRWPKRTVLYTTDLIRAGVALTFILAYDQRQMWILYLGSALLGTCSSLFQPARQAAVRQVVPVSDLVQANALSTGTAGLVAVLGAAGGGMVAAWVSPDIAFIVNAASYLWSAAWILAAVWDERQQSRPRASYLAQLAAGARALRQNRIVLAAVIASLGFALTSGPYYVAPPVLGDLVYGMGGLGIGLLFAADGLGFILSSALLRRIDPARLRAVYGGSFFVQAVFLCLLCFSTRLWEGMAAILISQVAAGAILTLTTAFLQQHTEPGVQGRVFAVQSAASGALGQLSIAAAGFVMARSGVPAVGVPVALVCVGAGALWLRLTAGEPTLAPA